jgi:ABC-type uncharacterized transport system ATPase subunit
VRDASGVQRLRAASFELRAGEVLALAGIDGNGQQELADALAGMALPTAGRILLDGVDITARRRRPASPPASPTSRPTAPAPAWCKACRSRTT